jgi:hypothetical protein
MEDLARRGFTGVLHTFSENDLNYYRDQMRRIVEVSHGVGLEVQVNPWGLGHAFGGEAECLFVATRPEVSQVFDDGRSVGAGCPNRPEFRAFVRSWAAGGEDLWTWGYEACGHMDHLGTREPEEVWAALTEDLTSDAHPAKGA